MKPLVKLFAALPLCVLLSSNTYSQTFTQQADSLIGNLSKTAVTTGILYDRVLPVAGLHYFNTRYNNADTSSYLHFRDAYSEMYRATYANSSMLHEDYLDTAIMIGSSSSGIIPISLMNFDFNMLDTNAVQNNLIYGGTDSLFYDVQNRQSSPFWLKNAVQMKGPTILNAEKTP